MTNSFHQNDFSTDKSQNLPIIQKLISTYKVWQNYLPNLSKTCRLNLGAKIDAIFLEIIENIFIAAHESQFRERERE